MLADGSFGYLDGGWLARCDVYMNFLGERGQDRVKAGYGKRAYARLVDRKRSYDSTNLFRVNQNIPPLRGYGR